MDVSGKGLLLAIMCTITPILLIAIQTTASKKDHVCPPGCGCYFSEYKVTVRCHDPYYVKTIPMLPDGTLYLEIEKCNISKLADNIFYKNGGARLRSVKIRKSGISSIHINAFRGMNFLQNLLLQDNDFSTLTGDEFCPLYNVSVLT